MVDIVIISFALLAVFILLPNVLHFHATGKNTSENPNNATVPVKIPSKAGRARAS